MADGSWVLGSRLLHAPSSGGAHAPVSLAADRYLSVTEEEASGIMAVLLETTLGDIVIDLFTEERPKCKKSYKITTCSQVGREFK